MSFELTQKLMTLDGAANDNFGYSVSMSNNMALIGAYRHDNTGAAYLFNLTTGELLYKFTAPDGKEKDEFGYSVYLSENKALIGAYGDDAQGTDSGSAYLFDTATGQLIHRLTAPDSQNTHFFGSAVTTYQDKALIGASGDDSNGNNSGSVYLFNANTGQPIYKLIAPDREADDHFGRSIALNQDKILVGSPLDDDDGLDSGSAYLFDSATGNFIRKLTAPDADWGDRFGESVALYNNIALIGALTDDDNGSDSGAAYIFDVTTGEPLHKLTAPDGAADDHFGRFVALHGNIALIGAEGNDEGGTDSGAAYLFDTTTGEFIQKLTVAEGSSGNFLGVSVAMGENMALIGANLDDEKSLDSGAAYLFMNANNIVENPPKSSNPFSFWMLGGIFLLCLIGIWFVVNRH